MFLCSKMLASCVGAPTSCSEGVVFSVRISDDIHFPFEEVALIGDHPSLGAWKSQEAIVMDRCYDDRKLWMSRVRLPPGIVVQYRYFITAVDCEASENASEGAKQIHRWESSAEPRSYKITLGVPKPSDTFGVTSGFKKEVALGWLTCGRIVQFTMQPEGIKITDERFKDLAFNVKVQPINLCTTLPMPDKAHVFTEYINLSCGGSSWHPQPGLGVPYNNKYLLVFQTRVCELRHIAYELQLLTRNCEARKEACFGAQRIIPTLLQASTGHFELKIISNVYFVPIATLDLEFLVIAPSSRDNFEFGPTRTMWLQTNECLDVGHRGLGQSHRVREKSPIVENTIASLQIAGNCGVDMVEFDVVLTKDLIPIVYHDFCIMVCKDGLSKPKKETDLKEVYIDTLTYTEVSKLDTYYYVHGEMRKFFARNKILKQSNVDIALFPTLQEVFEKIDPSVSFDLDIKWPQLWADGECEGYNKHDKNLFVDCILNVIRRYCEKRFFFISCFDSGLCALFRLKQNIYPVMFITSDRMLHSCAGPEYADPAAQTVLVSIDFAQAFDLAGIVPHEMWIKYDSWLVECAHKFGLKVLIWGNNLNNDQTLKQFKLLGLDGLIYDRADLLCPKKPKKGRKR